MTGNLCPECGRVAPSPVLSCPACGAWLASGVESELARRVALALGDHYRVEEEIGRGGYAVVFRVSDLRLDRDLAAKALRPDLAGIPELAERFRREAKTAARLNHPNIVPIYFVGGEAVPCYVMPMIQGETLAARLRREGQFPFTTLVAVARDIADALDYAHAAGVVHRDVKPDNVVIEFATGRSLLTDFGIARALATDTPLTASGVIIGTPHYMSPEQAAGERDLTRQSDVYSLGVVIYEMLAGAPPFDGDSAHQIFAGHMSEAVPPLRGRRPDVREPVDEVVRRALAKAPEERYAGASELVRALERAQGRSSVRRSGDTVMSQQSADDVRLFRTVGAASGTLVVAFRDASDVASVMEAVNGIRDALRQALDTSDVASVLEHLELLVERIGDPQPGLRRPVREALAGLGSDEGLIELLAGAWRAGAAETQNRAEHALRALLPDAATPLITLARRHKSAEFLVLADRVGALDDAAGDALARSDSPAEAQALGRALRESVRPRPMVERWLGLLVRHSHPDVRALAIDTAAIHGGDLATRVARLALADSNTATRHAAIKALGASRRRDVLADLSRVLEHGARDDQCVAADALGTLATPEAVPVLRRVFARRRLFRPERGPVQQAAARALAALPDAAGSVALAELQDHPDPEVQRVARQALAPRR